MSRLTGKEVYSLMEAYQAVYTPQEITEEQVWEGVENWVNSLLEEGYDLSDYTWEEMYESYLSEGPYDAANVQRVQQVAQDGQAKRDAAAATLKAQRRSQDVTDYRKAMLPPTPKKNTMDGRYATPGTQRGNQDKYKSTSDGKMYANYNDALAANRSRNKNTITPGLPKVNQRPGAPTPSVRPVPSAPAPSVRPAPGAPTPSVRPAPGAPTPSVRPAPAPRPAATPEKPMGGDPMDQWARANPTLAARVKPGQSGYNTIKARLDADSVRPAPAPRPAATPEKPMGGDPMDQWARANPTLAARVKPGQSGYNTIKARLDADNDRQENYDAYGLVFSYLINEGYANTQDSALAIMANMSEDWKWSILSEAKKTTADDMEKGDLYSAMFRRDKKVKGAKYYDPSANKYLNMKNSKDRQKRYDDDMGKVHTDMRPSR